MASKDSADDELVAVTAAGFLALLPLAELGESSTRSSSSTRTSTAAGFLALLPLAELGESSTRSSFLDAHLDGRELDVSCQSCEPLALRRLAKARLFSRP